MSSRHWGRGSGGRNTLAASFRAPAKQQPPDSPEDTCMDEDLASPVQTVQVPSSSSSTSSRMASPFPSTAPKPISDEIRDTNLGTRLRLTNLEEAFQAMQEHLMVVQERHIDDIQSLEAQVATLTSHVSQLKKQLLQYQTTIPAQRLPTPPPQQQQPGPKKLPEHSQPDLLPFHQTKSQPIRFSPNATVPLSLKEKTPPY